MKLYLYSTEDDEIVLNKTLKNEKVIDINFKASCNQLDTQIILNYKLMDIYENDNNKKITIRYNLGSKERTLTSEELENFKTEFINHIRTNKLEIQEN